MARGARVGVDVSGPSKGYVVRYTNDRGTFYVTAPKWLDDFTIGSRADEGSLFETLGGATAAARHPRRVSDVAIFRVLDDGREERLPSYEEALGALSILRDEAQAAQDHKRGGGMTCGGPPLLWTCPPSALKELLRLADGAPVGDPLAALEAAERRLLEAGGWREMAPSGKWIDGVAGLCESRAVALTIARLAAKGARARPPRKVVRDGGS